MNVSSVSPQTLFGGTWDKIQDKFLLAAGTTYSAGSTGGAVAHTHTTADHTLTIDEISSRIYSYNNADGGISTNIWCYINSYKKVQQDM